MPETVDVRGVEDSRSLFAGAQEGINGAVVVHRGPSRGVAQIGCRSPDGPATDAERVLVPSGDQASPGQV
ncbi:hypothetical protein GCM10010207_77830 [Streptomyces atratus]|nr:hypothetical protein GCM10010207_77830 [Streptomyces atratus]